MNNTMPQFENDVIISWDVSNADLPSVSVLMLRRDGSTNLVADVLGISHERTGVVSLRQLLAEKEAKR